MSKLRHRHHFSRLSSPNVERLCRSEKMQPLPRHIWLVTNLWVIMRSTILTLRVHETINRDMSKESTWLTASSKLSTSTEHWTGQSYCNFIFFSHNRRHTIYSPWTNPGRRSCRHHTKPRSHRLLPWLLERTWSSLRPSTIYLPYLGNCRHWDSSIEMRCTDFSVLFSIFRDSMPYARYCG